MKNLDNLSQDDLDPEQPAVRIKNRRRWTETEKQAIVLECSETGASVSAVAKRHLIPTNLLFQWCKQYDTCMLTVHDGGELSRIDRSRRDLAEIDKLERLQHITMAKLTEEIKRSQITSYNASIATSNIVSGFAKLTALRADILDKLDQLESLKAAEAIDTDDEDLALQREAESLVVELVRRELERKKDSKSNALTTQFKAQF
jgi:transposase-like protein